MGEGHRCHECARAHCLDALHSVWPIASADGIICINMIHISPWQATVGLIKGAAAILPSRSPLYLYGPYKREGFETAPSNQAFDQSLRDRDPNWGLRHLEAVAATAKILGFSGPVIIAIARKQSERCVPPNVIVSLRGQRHRLHVAKGVARWPM
jgi:hypothetical protein